jgi:cytoskeletal protein RodZ
MEITNPNPNAQSKNSQTTPATSFGAMLLQAREAKKLSLEDAAAELFILKRHLQALEQENFQALPQVTFARGFAINYAKYLGLDPHAVADSFDAAYPSELRTKAVGDIESPLRPMGTLQREGRAKIRFNPLLLLAVIGVIALAVFLLRMVTNANDETAEPTPTIDTISPAEQAEGAYVPGAEAASGVAIGANNTATNASGSALNLDNSATSTADGNNLEFWVKDNTEITVTDAAGNSLMSGMQSRGGYKLSGQAPFQIQVNDVANVDLNLNQEAVDLSKFATNNKASFTLAP